LERFNASMLKRENPDRVFDPGLNITPPMPFRRITRSLSVTGG
jgi:hypothetical protein